ncbi:MAG: indolepyruvate oxidoreductase subunit beta [Eubacteriaceae bacterium]|nr:indolepyruvate oxidoreductase subunit beta [Eubacteriaceae bacterium]
MKKNILLCGVGGQGTVLASKLIASAAMAMNQPVRSAETIGMAQRGGSVTSHVRIGEDIFSPLIPEGTADIIMAFEPGEAVRNLKYLKKEGVVVVNSIPVKPVTESLKDTGYDGKKEIEYLEKKCRKVIVVDAMDMCRELGSAKFFNVAILGVAVGTGETGLEIEPVEKEIRDRVPERFADVNIDAFRKGLKLGQRSSKR